MTPCFLELMTLSPKRVKGFSAKSLLLSNRHLRDIRDSLPFLTISSFCDDPKVRWRDCTVIQDILKIGQECSTVPLAQERVSERPSERMSAAERASEASSAEQANE